MNKRQIASSLAAFVVLFAACAPAASSPQPSSSNQASADPAWQQVLDAAKKEGKVLVYGLILSGAEGAKMAEEFQKQTGITVDFVTGPGAPTVQRLREESKGGQPSADIWEGSYPWVGVVKNEGFFVPQKEKALPSLKDKASFAIDPEYLSNAGDLFVSRPPAVPGHVVVNTKLVQPADYPKSYHDLATNPKYQGKVAWVDPKTTGEIAFRWVHYGYVADVFSLEDVWSLYTKQNITLYPTPLEVGPAVARGEVPIGIANTSLEAMADAGAPFKLLMFPDVPFVEVPSAMGVIKNARNPNAALVFINWVLS
jgi:iron(III) transport system substrate-binding protein